VQDEGDGERQLVDDEECARQRGHRIQRHRHDAAAQRMEAVGQHSERIGEDEGDDETPGGVLAEVVQRDVKFFREEDAEAVHRSESDSGQHDHDEDQQVIAGAETLPAIFHHRGEGAFPLQFRLGNRRIFALFHQKTHQREADGVGDAQAHEEQRIVTLRVAEQFIVEDDSGEQAHDAEHAVEAAEQFPGNHVVDERGKEDVAGLSAEFEERPERAENQQRAPVGAEIFPDCGVLEKFPEMDAERHAHQSDEDDGRGDEEIGDAPPEPAAVAVGTVADERTDHHADRAGKRVDDEAVEKVRSPQLLDQQQRDHRGGALPHRPDEISGQKQEKEEQDATQRIGERPGAPPAMFRCVAHTGTTSRSAISASARQRSRACMSSSVCAAGTKGAPPAAK